MVQSGYLKMGLYLLYLVYFKLKYCELRRAEQVGGKRAAVGVWEWASLQNFRPAICPAYKIYRWSRN